MRRSLIAVACAAAIAAMARPDAQAPPAPTAEIVDLAGKYVDAYIEAFSGIVSEEKQTQKLIRPDGRVRQTREITADFLLVKARATWPEAYRDVIEVDGKRVRNRQDRLKKLFLDEPKSAPELADAIAAESGRYNLGVRRRGNSPLLPIIFLTSKIAEGVRFQGTAAALTFQEFRTPTVLRRRTGGGPHNMPSHGTFEIDPATGRVLAAEFTADDAEARMSAVFKVRYAIEPKLEMSVPVDVTERYRQPAKPEADVLEMRATYSGFRKFQVTTAEQIKK
jgi:hypothetical protein